MPQQKRRTFGEQQKCGEAFYSGERRGKVEIANNPQDFNPVTQETTKGAQAIDRAAEELTNLTSRLQSKAGAFQVD